MDKNIPNDIDVIKIKKKKRSATEKRKKTSSKMAQKNFQKLDNNDISSGNKLNLNLNKTRKSQDIQLNNNKENTQIESLETIRSSLDKIQEMIIKQESDILEAVTGCQEPNNYHIYGKLQNGEKYYIFKFKEFSSCGMRFWCPVSCRELIMKIKIAYDEKENEDENDNDEEFNNSFLYIEKKFKCPCCNCIRPEMRVFITETNTLLGTIEEGFSCCDPIFNVYDKDGKVIYNIETDCCQCGFMCRNNCWGKTDECVFFIYDAEKRSNAIGEISKKAAASQLSIADNYSVLFPTNATLEQKILLTVAGVMIDYQYFENNTNTVK
jgi:hypothetical protein